MKTNLWLITLALVSGFGSSYAIAQSSGSSAGNAASTSGGYYWFQNPDDQTAYITGVQIAKRADICSRVPAPNCALSPADQLALDKYHALDKELKTAGSYYADLDDMKRQEDQAKQNAAEYQIRIKRDQDFKKNHPLVSWIDDYLSPKDHSSASILNEDTDSLKSWQLNAQQCAKQEKEDQQDFDRVLQEANLAKTLPTTTAN